MKKTPAKEQSWESIGKAIGAKIEKESKDGCYKGWNFKGPTSNHGGASAVYILGFIGALVYFLTTATSLWMGVVGVFKAIFWPAYLVFGAMKFLGM
ncbi:MAG: hypothetical protein WC506_06715 [Candidatus Micrarchaeia archaeon]